MMYPLVHLLVKRSADWDWLKWTIALEQNVFPAGQVNFEQAVYRSLERSPQDTWDGFDL